MLKVIVYDQTKIPSASLFHILWFGRILYPVYIFYYNIVLY